MHDERQWGQATKAIRAGLRVDPTTRALNTPIYETTTFAYEDMASYERISAAALAWQPDNFFYSRTQNPTTAALERKIAALEGTEDAAITACGMGAVNMALLSQLKTGDHFIASDDMFVVSKLSLEDIYTRYGIDHDMVDMTNLDNIRAKFRPNTKVIYLEVLSNPHLKLMDVQAIARLAHERGAKLIVDNTFLSPCLLQPYALGADIVLHSATKYISGHGDALCGVVSGSKELMDRVRIMADRLGSHISAFDAWLVLRGVRTLSMRAHTASENALALARYLETCPQVEYVRYPGLESHPQYALAQKMLHRGFGGMLAFHLKGGYAEMGRFVDALQLISYATSLGDVGSLVYPIHSDDGLVRISVGCENAEDLLDDIKRGLSAL